MASESVWSREEHVEKLEKMVKGLLSEKVKLEDVSMWPKEEEEDRCERE